MVNYAYAFRISESGKYFEWIIKMIKSVSTLTGQYTYGILMSFEQALIHSWRFTNHLWAHER